MPHRFEGIYWVSEPPAIELVDGNFMLTFAISEGCCFKVVMSPANFLKTRRSNGRVLAAFHAGKRNVIGFPHPDPDEGFADSGVDPAAHG